MTCLEVRPLFQLANKAEEIVKLTPMGFHRNRVAVDQEDNSDMRSECFAYELTTFLRSIP
jgi:hypothetical protein